MEDAKSRWQRPRPWIALVVIVILIIVLLFYQPFEQYLIDNIPRIHFSNVLFGIRANPDQAARESRATCERTPGPREKLD